MRYVVWLMLCGAAPLFADVYRCPTPQGPVFQDRPCAGAGERVRIEPGRSSAATPGIRETERRWLEARERRQRKTRKEGVREKVSMPRRTDAATRRCWQKRRQLETVRQRLRRGYRVGEGDRLRQRARELEDYLFRFCD